MSSEVVAKTVGKKLRQYFEVKRLEDGFDLSGVNAPQLNHPPLKSRPTLQYDGLHDRALKHYFSQPDVKTKLTQLSPQLHGDMREEDIKRIIKQYMHKHRNVGDNHQNSTMKLSSSKSSVREDKPAKKLQRRRARAKQRTSTPSPSPPDQLSVPDWMYKYNPRHGKTIRPEYVGFGVPLKSQKHKSLKGGWPQLRSVPGHRVNKGEAHRLIDVATKILVATERIDHMQSRSTSPHSKYPAAPKPFESNREISKDMKRERPSTAKYSWDIDGRRHVRPKEGTSQTRDGKSSGKRRAYDDSFLPDWLMKQPDKQKDERPKTPEPSSTPDRRTPEPRREQKMSPRPKSAKYRQRPSPKLPSSTVINIPEPDDQREDVVVNNSTQTADTVGIQTEKRLLEEYDHREDLVESGPRAEYQVYVQTGDRVGASTKADVKVTLYGEKGRSKEFTLDRSTRNKVKFQRGKEDLFLLATRHLGKLRKIKIGHDRPELSYAWYCDGVSVSDMHDKRIYDFRCRDWFSGQDHDGKTYRDVTLDRERAFVEAYDDVRDKKELTVGRDRHKKDDSSESRASRDDKRSVESQKGSREDYSDSDSSTTSYTSSSTVSSSSTISSRGKGRRSGKTPSPKSKTPPPRRDLSPPRKPQKDNFFDQKSSGPIFTFRSSQDGEQKPDEEYLSGYKAGLDAVESQKKTQADFEADEKMRLLNGPTIHDAARMGNMGRMQDLLDQFPEMKDAKDETGWTALHVAVQQGRLEIVKWLAASNMDLNQETPTGYTPIHVAAMNGHVNCMIVLAAMGAALTCRTVDRQMPLHLAAMNGHIECVKWLIANRASLDAEDSLGRTPLALADDYQRRDIADLIQKCQAEARDPDSSLHAMRGSRKGLEPIREGSNEMSLDKMWRNDDEDTQSEDSLSSKSRSSRGGSDGEGGHSRKSTSHELQEKRRIYEEQHQRMEQTGTSFLDSIRDELQ